MTVIGEAYIEVKGDTKGFADETERGVLGSVGGIAKKAAGVLGGAFAVAGAVNFGRDIFEAAELANKGLAQTENVIKSTGGAANISADDITGLTQALEDHTAVNDDVIRGGANMLLTFTNVKNEVGEGNDIFNQATSILTDMSVAMGTDMKGQAIQLGKALNDPIAGVSALAEVGVTFTEQQKEQIAAMVEAGDVAGAQRVILAELNKEFGGSAAAQATAADRAKLKWAEFKEELGQRLMPVIASVATFMADKLPAAAETVFGVIGRVSAIIGGLFALFAKGDFTGNLGAALGVEEDSAIVGHLFTIRDAFISLIGFVRDTVIPIVRDQLVPIIGSVLGAAFNVIVTVMPVVVGAFSTLVGILTNPVFQVVAAIIAVTLVPALISMGINAALAGAQVVFWWVAMHTQAIASAATTVAQLVLSGAKFIWLGITALASAAQVALAWLIAMGPIALVVAAVVAAAALIVHNWDWIKETVGNVVAAIGGFLGDLVSWVANAISSVIGWIVNAVAAVFDFQGRVADALGRVVAAFGRMVSGAAEQLGELIGWVAGIPGRILGALGDVGSMLYNAGLAIMRGLRDGIVAGFRAVADFVGGIAGKIADLKGPLDYDKRLLVPAGNAIMEGLERSLAARQVAVERRVRAITASIAQAGAEGATAPTTATTGANTAAGLSVALLAELRALVAALAATGGPGSGTWNVSGTDPVAVAAVIERRFDWRAGG